MDLFAQSLSLSPIYMCAHASTSIPWRVGNFYLISPRQQLSIQKRYASQVAAEVAESSFLACL